MKGSNMEEINNRGENRAFWIIGFIVGFLVTAASISIGFLFGYLVR